MFKLSDVRLLHVNLQENFLGIYDSKNPNLDECIRTELHSEGVGEVSCPGWSMDQRLIFLCEHGYSIKFYSDILFLIFYLI